MPNSTFTLARGFLYRNARPLDIARFQYHFENGPREPVLAALAAYQNEDGGFGHALEPDAWNPNSSPIQTWTATEVLREIGFTDESHSLIQGILRYLASGKDFDGRFWHNTVRSNNDYPHAPWWHTESDSTSHNNYNPTACLAGFIVRFADRDSDLCKLGRRIAKEAFDSYISGDLLGDMHTVSCYIRLLEYTEEAGVTDAFRRDASPFDTEALKARLREQVKHSITSDTTKWEAGYICKPSQFFTDRNSVFYLDNEEITHYECNFIARTQLRDGSWAIPWNWTDYPEEWAISKNWWKGNGAILNLLYLRGMGRLGLDPLQGDNVSGSFAVRGSFHLGNGTMPDSQLLVSRICDPEEKERIARKILLSLPDWFGIPQRTQEYIEDSSGQPFWAALHDGEPVGFITLAETGDHTAELHVMGVHPDHHRQGIGRRLFSALYNFCRQKGYRFLQVKTVDAGRYQEYDRTRSFYEAMGFRKFEVLPTLWDENNPCLVMVMAVE